MQIISYSEARDSGLQLYFTGKPCKNGHVEQRYVANRGCVICTAVATKKSHTNLVEHRAQYHKEWKRNNRDKCAAATRAYRERNPDYEAETGAKWRAENRHRLTANQAKRRAIKVRATVVWADHGAIEAIFAEARRLTKETGILHHVDHIVPLSSELVCGLHWEGNLQVLPGSENIAKLNRTWPDMP